MMQKIEKNWSYKITDTNHPKCGKTLWSGRYCAVTGIVCYIDENDVNWFLITKRGSGAADYQGKWCMPCGFLEANETGEQGTIREVKEETGISIPKAYLFSVETDPKYCNNGNVTLRYASILDEMPVPNYVNINGEENEVENVKWISEDEIENYDFCFNHKDLIYLYLYHCTGNYFEKIKHRLNE